MMRHNRPLVLLCPSSLLFLTGMFSLQTVGVYYARDVLGNADLYIVMTIVQTVGMISPPRHRAEGWSRAFGKKRTYLSRAPSAPLAGVGVAFAPGSAPAVGSAASASWASASAAINTLIFALQADTVDYGEWKSGSAPRGRATPCSPSRARPARASAARSPRTRSPWLGYVSGAAIQDENALNAIRSPPASSRSRLILPGMLILFRYPLTEQTFATMVAGDPGPPRGPLTHRTGRAAAAGRYSVLTTSASRASSAASLVSSSARTRRVAPAGSPVAAPTAASAAASLTGVPAPRRWAIQAATARTAPAGIRPAARSARSTGSHPTGQLQRAVGGDLRQPVLDARVGPPLDQRRPVCGDLVGGQRQVPGRLVPPLLQPAAGSADQ